MFNKLKTKLRNLFVSKEPLREEHLLIKKEIIEIANTFTDKLQQDLVKNEHVEAYYGEIDVVEVKFKKETKPKVEKKPKNEAKAKVKKEVIKDEKPKERKKPGPKPKVKTDAEKSEKPKERKKPGPKPKIKKED